MTSATDRHLLTDAAETYNVPLPPYIGEAQAMLDAATAYLADVVAMTEPSLSDVTPKTIGKVVDAVLAFRNRDERLKLAQRVESNAATALDFAFQRFKHTLMTDLAAPFDAAAQQFMDRYATYKTQDPATVATITALVRVRDLLAGRVGEGLPAQYFDIPTRTATFACRHDIVNRFRLRTAGTERGTQAWLEALLSIPGLRLRWQTPDMQREHVARLPAELDRDSTVGSTRGGDAA